MKDAAKPAAPRVASAPNPPGVGLSLRSKVAHRSAPLSVMSWPFLIALQGAKSGLGFLDETAQCCHGLFINSTAKKIAVPRQSAAQLVDFSVHI